MGYYSDLQIRLMETGYKPTSRSFDQVARMWEIHDCAKMQGLKSCQRCTRKGQPDCPIVLARQGK